MLTKASIALAIIIAIGSSAGAAQKHKNATWWNAHGHQAPSWIDNPASPGG
jgi:hypothetical protein